MTERYSFSLTTFSPSGKLVQIEYALKAVDGGAPSVGIKSCDGVVLAVEKKFDSSLIDETSIQRIQYINKNIGFVYSGLSPDYRLLVRKARKIADEYYLQNGDLITPEQLSKKVASLMQEFTQSGGVRPFGVSLLIAGWDNDTNKSSLYQCDPSGTYFPWRATALGKKSANMKSFLEKRFSEKMELDDAVQTAILTLKEGFEGQMNEDNIEVGISTEMGFRVLNPSEIKDYLSNIE